MTTPIGMPKWVGKISQGSIPRRATWCIYKYVAIIKGWGGHRHEKEW